MRYTRTRGNMADRKANNYLCVFLSIGSNLSEKRVAIDYNEHFHAPIPYSRNF